LSSELSLLTAEARPGLRLLLVPPGTVGRQRATERCSGYAL